MKTLREQYGELEKAIQTKFDTLTKEGKEFNFIENIITDDNGNHALMSDEIEEQLEEVDELGELSTLPMIQRTCQGNGSEVDCYVVSVLGVDIIVADFEDPKTPIHIKIYDVNNVYSKIELIEEMNAFND
jgi:hypothetical protein